jgi:hypothetical protein
MIFQQFLYPQTGCAAYVFGRVGHKASPPSAINRGAPYVS